MYPRETLKLQLIHPVDIELFNPNPNPKSTPMGETGIYIWWIWDLPDNLSFFFFLLLLLPCVFSLESLLLGKARLCWNNKSSQSHRGLNNKGLFLTGNTCLLSGSRMLFLSSPRRLRRAEQLPCETLVAAPRGNDLWRISKWQYMGLSNQLLNEWSKGHFMPFYFFKFCFAYLRSI